MSELYTTLNRIRACSPCGTGWTKLLKHLGKTQADDEPLPYRVILEANGLDDALWACRAEPQLSAHWRLYAVGCARSVMHLATDPRSIRAIDVAQRHALGQADDKKLATAAVAATDAARAEQAAEFLRMVTQGGYDIEAIKRGEVRHAN